LQTGRHTGSATRKNLHGQASRQRDRKCYAHRLVCRRGMLAGRHAL
jgi:hypothetical protein